MIVYKVPKRPFIIIIMASRYRNGSTIEHTIHLTFIVRPVSIRSRNDRADPVRRLLPTNARRRGGVGHARLSAAKTPRKKTSKKPKVREVFENWGAESLNSVMKVRPSSNMRRTIFLCEYGRSPKAMTSIHSSVCAYVSEAACSEDEKFCVLRHENWQGDKRNLPWSVQNWGGGADPPPVSAPFAKSPAKSRRAC